MKKQTEKNIFGMILPIALIIGLVLGLYIYFSEPSYTITKTECRNETVKEIVDFVNLTKVNLIIERMISPNYRIFQQDILNDPSITLYDNRRDEIHVANAQIESINSEILDSDKGWITYFGLINNGQPIYQTEIYPIDIYYEPLSIENPSDSFVRISMSVTLDYYTIVYNETINQVCEDKEVEALCYEQINQQPAVITDNLKSPECNELRSININKEWLDENCLIKFVNNTYVSLDDLTKEYETKNIELKGNFEYKCGDYKVSVK